MTKEHLWIAFGLTGQLSCVRNLQVIRNQNKLVAQQKAPESPQTIPMTAHRPVASSVQRRKAA